MGSQTLIFGGSGGVGSALARALSGQGVPVHLFARDAERLKEVASGLEQVGTSAVDVTDSSALKEAVTQAVGDDGISGLAYCIGSIVLKPLKRATDADFLESFRLNALGAAMAVQAAELALRKGRGSVVLFSTVAAGSGFSNHSVTAAAKGAVEALTRSLAADLAPDVRVNCIAPSLLQTPLAKPITDNEIMAKSIAQLHPVPRLGEAEDAASLAAFLLSADSGWISGQVIPLDGGRSTVRVKG
jgi:NAD(P)-dependent dehydrogenase (short-subunit alcohol dehydrogenase family)